jgi:hypothetical protein
VFVLQAVNAVLPHEVLMTSRLLALTLAAPLVLALSGLASAQTTSVPEAKHDTSPALSTIPAPPDLQGRSRLERIEHRVKPLPHPAQGRVRAQPDAARQVTAVRKFQATVLPAFDGIGGITGYTVQSDPPDTTAAVGRTQVVEWVNTALAVFDKSTGAMQGHILDGNSLFSGFGGDCQTFNDGDPIVAYDKIADRWVLSQFAVTGGENGGTFSYCVAVSQSPDARGTYNRYEFKFNDFNDYPKMGVWPDGYYVSFNMFHQNSFAGAKVCALARDKMLAGQAATMQCFDVADQGGLLPSDLDGMTSPPTGTPNYVLNFDFDGAHLNLWKFHVDWANPANSTFTKSAPIAVSKFAPACDSCIAQPSGGIGLQSLGDRLMYRLAYRQFADHESLVVTHTVSVGGGNGPTGIRWYELRSPGTTPVVFQQSTYAPNHSFRWIGSAAMDKAGNMLLGYSVSSPTVKPSIAFAGRLATDAASTMSAEKIVLPGTGVQTDPDRWGDYASVTLDPTDDCTFYFATQYLKVKGSFNWQTRVAKFTFPSCQ